MSDERKGEKIELTVRDRIIIEQFFGQSNKTTAIVIDSIYQKIKLNPEEQKKIGFKLLQDGGVFFDETKTGNIFVFFSDVELEILKGCIDKLDKQEKIHYTWVSTIRKLTNP